MARIVAIVVVAALAASPAAALGAPGELLSPTPAPEQPLLQNQVQETPAPAPAPAPASTDDTTIGSGTLLLVGLAVVLLIGGIWLAISRDARRATAGRMHAQPAGGSTTRAARRSRKLSAAERRRRKRGRAH